MAKDKDYNPVRVYEREQPTLSGTVEIGIMDLEVPYATIWHSKTQNTTILDLHIRIEEAKELYEALRQVLEVQTEVKSGD